MNNEELFQKKKLRSTKNRNAVYNILKRATYPMTADEIYDILKKKDSSVNLSTVYRILSVFTEKGLVTRQITDKNQRAMYEMCREGHHKHYMICLSCHTMFPIEECPIHEVEKRWSEKNDFLITEHELKIYGYCHCCRQKMKREE